MKKRLIMKNKLLTTFIFMFSVLLVTGQINLGKIKKTVKTGKDVKETVDENKKEKEEKKEEEAKQEEETSEENAGSEEKTTETEKEIPQVWSKFDFIPGDVIIFEDNLENEETGEFPSKWDLAEGNAEIALLGDQQVIKLVSQGTSVLPLMDKKDFLPEVFTIEFDIWFSEIPPNYNIYLWDQKQYKKNSSSIETTDKIKISQDATKMGDYKSEYENLETNTWHHISIAFNKRSLKLYINELRVLNIPNLEFKPKAFSVATGAAYSREETDIWLIKNVRIAEGGKKLYDRLETEGKIVTHGILFDVGKSTIKPQSMGTINDIYKMLANNPDLKFSIEGHTDNTGDEASNLQLSKDRAEAVMNKLIEMGISADRLSFTGHGESTPISENSSPEGRAMNRRVEFIKQ